VLALYGGAGFIAGLAAGAEADDQILPVDLDRR
jgi:hypothetical protein